MGSFSIWHWLIVLVIVLLVFGTKKLRNIGSVLGGAGKRFKEGMKGGDSAGAGGASQQKLAQGQTIEGEAREKVDQNRS